MNKDWLKSTAHSCTETLIPGTQCPIHHD